MLPQPCQFGEQHHGYEQQQIDPQAWVEEVTIMRPPPSWTGIGAKTSTTFAVPVDCARRRCRPDRVLSPDHTGSLNRLWNTSPRPGRPKASSSRPSFNRRPVWAAQYQPWVARPINEVSSRIRFLTPSAAARFDLTGTTSRRCDRDRGCPGNARCRGRRVMGQSATAPET